MRSNILIALSVMIFACGIVYPQKVKKEKKEKQVIENQKAEAEPEAVDISDYFKSYLDFNGTETNMTVSKTKGDSSVSYAFKISGKYIKNDKYSIKVGMTKKEVTKNARLMNLDIDKKTDKYWVVMGAILVFKNDKLIAIPGIANLM